MLSVYCRRRPERRCGGSAEHTRRILGSASGQQAPQIAFRYLDNYIAEKESKCPSRAAGIVGIVAGSGLGAGSAAAWYFGDSVSARLAPDGEPWDAASKSIPVGALAIGGALSIGTGVFLLCVPEPDYRAEYAYIYDETDPLLREAFAASALRRLSDEGRTQRLVSWWIDLSIPICAIVAQVSTNLSDDRAWYQDVFSVSSSQILQIARGISKLVFQRSAGENLYQEYRTAKSAAGFLPAP